ncbi:MAG TPA: sulfotransferase [Ideonella sp.]|uniref:sulfotransferase family protein n=1 Tax=Ideonella sp. TaxID=1929293 RepID=UPI002E2EA7B4|nr:sulfotransferase [Ideonella sp.]HEX5686281.1 sulfotransferase [Ideonella sp.]
MRFSFLMCSERSGSNLITRMLDAHSAICGPATKHLINPVARNAFRYEPLARPTHWQALLEDIHALLNAEFSHWRTNFSLDELARLAESGDLPTLIRRVFAAEAEAHGKTVVFVKENQVYEFIAFLLLHFPEATYVYQVRDPRDMALSWKNNPGHPGGVCRAARQWQADQQNSLKLYSDLHRLGRARLVYYEQLISEPEKVLTDVLGMMGLAYEPAMLSYHESALTRANAGQQHAWSNLDKAVMTDNSQKYRDALSADEIRAIESICYSEMQHLGYRCEFDKSELDRFAKEELARFEETDTRAKVHVQPNSVRANVEAKKRFYQRLPIKT